MAANIASIDVIDDNILVSDECLVVGPGTREWTDRFPPEPVIGQGHWYNKCGLRRRP
jgi:hypothetical protein